MTGERNFTIIKPTNKEAPSILPPEGSAERAEVDRQYQQVKRTIECALENLQTKDMMPEDYFVVLGDIIYQMAELGFVQEADELRSKGEQMINGLLAEGVNLERVRDIKNNYYYAAVKVESRFGLAKSALDYLHKIDDQIIQAHAYIDLGEARLEQQSSPEMVKMFFDKADDLLIDNLDDDSADIDACRASLYLLAVAQAKAGFFDDACDILHDLEDVDRSQRQPGSAIPMSADLACAYAEVGQELAKHGQIDQAWVLAGKVKDQALKNKIFKEIGLRQVADGDFSAASIIVKRDISDQEEDFVPTADVLLAIAEQLIAKKQFQAASDFIEELSAITPAHAFSYWCEAYCRMAKMQGAMKQPDETVQKYFDRAYDMARKTESLYKETLMLCHILEAKARMNQLSDEDWQAVKSIESATGFENRLQQLSALARTANIIGYKQDAQDILAEADNLSRKVSVKNPRARIVIMKPRMVDEMNIINPRERIEIVTAQMKVAGVQAEIFGLTPEIVKAYESEPNRQNK